MTDATPTPAARLEALTSLYERQAYVVWNVALRTALDDDRAQAAARRAFIAQVTAPGEERVAHDAARSAAEGAPAVDSREIEDQVLAATAPLAPAQRAALALTELADATGEQVAATLRVEPRIEEDLRARAYEQLGTLLGVSAAEARAAYADLPWAEPPEALWGALYPELHGEVTKHARATVAAQAASTAPAQRSRAVATLRRVPRVAVIATVVLAVAGVAWAATGGGGGSGGGAGDEPLGYADGSGGSATFSGETRSSTGGSAKPPLTPEQLDRLRQEEIKDLERFTRQKADKRLPPRTRRRAARKVSDLVKLAEARQRAAERRELAIRRALAREREARIRERQRRREEAASEDSEPAREQPARRDEPPEQEAPSREEPERRDEEEPEDTEAECLYDAGSGNYICPE